MELSRDHSGVGQTSGLPVDGASGPVGDSSVPKPIGTVGPADPPRPHRLDRPHPAGMNENSPPFQGWFSARSDGSSPEGTAESPPHTFSFAPGGTGGGRLGPGYPPLKGWAILGRPSGTKPETSGPLATGLAPRHPAGMNENSPPFQGWVSARSEGSSPEGTTESPPHTFSFAPDGAGGGRFGPGYPPLKGWAIVGCPSGTKPETSGPLATGLAPRHPAGMNENSPPFQGWVSARSEGSSPEGTTESPPHTFSFALDEAGGGRFGPGYPPLKGWAIVGCPSGTKPEDRCHRTSGLLRPGWCRFPGVRPSSGAAMHAATLGQNLSKRPAASRPAAARFLASLFCETIVHDI